MYLIAQLLDLYALGLLIYVILSWVQNPTADRVREGLGRLYLPLLRPLRAALKPVIIGGTALDLSPIVLFLAITLVRRFFLSF